MIASISDILFFPSKENEDKLCSILGKAEREILICIFYFTNKHIALTVLEKARKDKLKVRIITDDSSSKSIYS